MFLQDTIKTPAILKEVSSNATEISDVVSSSIDRMINTLLEQAPGIIAGIIVIFIFWIAASIIKRIFIFTSRRTHLDERLRLLFSRLLVIAIVIIGVFTALTVMIPNFGFSNLIASLGFSSFIIGFATKDILNNFLSGILVLWQEPFKMGDYVFVDDHEGEVVEIGLRATLLKMLDGERILIPNGMMYSSALIIREAGALQRVKIEIVTDYDSKVGLAKEKILGALGEIGGIVEDPKPNVYLTSLATEGINLRVYFWVDTENNSVLQIKDAVSSEINRSLREAGIKLFPPAPFVVKQGTKKSKPLDSDL